MKYRTIIKRTAWACVAIALLVIATVWWARSLKKDGGEPRVTGMAYTLPGGAVFGGPTPAADGKVVGSKGTVVYLPVMPPERSDAIHTATTAKASATLRTCFWPGPRTRLGVYTTDPDDFHTENQFSDSGTTYAWSSFQVPAQARLILKGRFPHLRHWGFVVYTPAGDVPTHSLSDVEIEADAGSSNPFRENVRRDVTERSYTLQIIAGDRPAKPLPNTLYTGTKSGQAVPIIMRNYVPDAGANVLGNVDWPEVEVQYEDGKVLKGQQACDATNTELRGKQVPVSLSQTLWLGLEHALTKDPLIAPAHDFTAEGMETFFNRIHVVTRLFLPRVAALNTDPSPKGGWFPNPATRYGYKFLSYRLGQVYAIRGKLPITPLTYHSDGSPARKSEMQYWSMCSNMGLATGLNIDCLYDEELEPLLDGDRHYTIVTTRLADRPSNATDNCGVAWMEFGNGDGVPGGSPDTMILVNRQTQVNPTFTHSWSNVSKPGDEAKVMGGYQPQVINLHGKAAFESLGCPVDTKKLDAMVLAASARR